MVKTFLIDTPVSCANTRSFITKCSLQQLLPTNKYGLANQSISLTRKSVYWNV